MFEIGIGSHIVTASNLINHRVHYSKMGSVAIDSADHVSNNPDLEFEIPDLPLGYARHLRIVCIGAGASGLCTAYQVRKHLRNVDLIIYEKNPVVGGTWYENKYDDYLDGANQADSVSIDILVVRAISPPTTTSCLGRPIQIGHLCM